MMTKAQIRQAREQLSAVVAAVEAGDLAATDVQLAHLRGSLAVLDALAG